MSGAVVTDRLLFLTIASMRRVAVAYNLPLASLKAAIREVRAELDRSGEVIDAYRAGIRVLVPGGFR